MINMICMICMIYIVICPNYVSYSKNLSSCLHRPPSTNTYNLTVTNILRPEFLAATMLS